MGDGGVVGGVRLGASKRNPGFRGVGNRHGEHDKLTIGLRLVPNLLGQNHSHTHAHTHTHTRSHTHAHTHIHTCTHL